MLAVVAPVLHRNVIPPVAVNVAGSPGQSGGTAHTIAHCGPEPGVMVVEHDDVHPVLASVTVTENVPAEFTFIVCVVSPVDHK